VKSLVALHGGEMTVQSKIDEGTQSRRIAARIHAAGRAALKHYRKR